MTMHLENSEEMLTFAPDDESQKRLVVRYRVFFDANYSRIRRLERSLIRNPQNSQSPELPLYKEILRILTKLRKNERKARGRSNHYYSSYSPLIPIEFTITLFCCKVM